MPTLGVKLFFVLSGYLITRLLLQARSRVETSGSSYGSELWGFYGRRFVRLFPALFVLITIAALIGVEPVRSSYWWHITYLSNIWLARHGEWAEYVTHLWSLSVEEQFYLFWPLAILFTPRNRLVLVTVAVMTCGLLFRAVAVATNMNHVTSYVLPFASLNALGFGSLLAIAGETPAGQKLRRSSLFLGMPLLGGLLVLMRMHLVDHATNIFYDCIVGFAFVWLVGGAADGLTGLAGRLLSARPLVALGIVSYGVYLYHLFVPEAIGWAFHTLGHPGPMFIWPLTSSWVTAFRLNPLTNLAINIAGSIGAAVLSWWLVERPSRRLRVFLPYSANMPDPLSLRDDQPATATSAGVANPDHVATV